MDNGKKNDIGSISWIDLTIDGATGIREFYRKVTGWMTTDVEMGGYNDYCMNEPATGKTVAGICHARGENANLPLQWLIYINVEDLERSIASCVALGGRWSRVRRTWANRVDSALSRILRGRLQPYSSK